MYREMVCTCHERKSNKETPSAENIMGGDKCGQIPNTSGEHMHGTRQFHSITSSDNSTLQIWTRLKACFCSSCSIGEWGDCEHTDTVDTWDRVTLGTNFNGVNEIDHLEDDQTHISTDYDHISDLIQVGT